MSQLGFKEGKNFDQFSTGCTIKHLEGVKLNFSGFFSLAPATKSLLSEFFGSRGEGIIFSLRSL